MTFNRAIVKRINHFLKLNNNMSRYRLEKETTIPHSTMESIFRETTKTMNVKTLLMIIKGLNTSVSEFFNDPSFDLETLDIE